MDATPTLQGSIARLRDKWQLWRTRHDPLTPEQRAAWVAQCHF